MFLVEYSQGLKKLLTKAMFAFNLLFNFNIGMRCQTLSSISKNNLLFMDR